MHKKEIFNSDVLQLFHKIRHIKQIAILFTLDYVQQDHKDNDHRNEDIKALTIHKEGRDIDDSDLQLNYSTILERF